MKPSINFLNRALLMILFAWAISACQPEKTAIDSDKEKTALSAWNDQGLKMVRNLNKENAETFVRFTYSEDAIIFPPNAKSIMGQEALIRFYQNYPPMSDFNQEIEEIEVFDNYAYLRLNYSFPIDQSGLNPYIDTGVIFCIMRKQNDGTWKIWREIWNSDITVQNTPTNER